MTRMIFALLALTAASPALAQIPLGTETTIPYAANGGIRNMQAEGSGSNIIYLQDRTQRWYKVVLSGPCLPDRTLDAISFKTDSNGTFDRFSQIRSLKNPERTCGVTSIVGSAPPEGQPGAPKSAR